jgi:hypothetical protein
LRVKFESEATAKDADQNTVVSKYRTTVRAGAAVPKARRGKKGDAVEGLHGVCYSSAALLHPPIHPFHQSKRLNAQTLIHALSHSCSYLFTIHTDESKLSASQIDTSDSTSEVLISLIMPYKRSPHASVLQMLLTQASILQYLSNL